MMKLSKEQARLLLWGLELLFYDSRAYDYRKAIEILKKQLKEGIDKASKESDVDV